jgi:hypothetical protein
MTPERLAYLRALASEGRAIADAASPAPWGYSCVYSVLDDDLNEICSVRGDGDMRFIADARTRVPALADGVEELAAEVERLQAVMGSMRPIARQHRAEIDILRRLERAVFCGDALACSPDVPAIMSEYLKFWKERQQ